MILSDAIIWNAPDGDSPARRSSQRLYDAMARKAKDEWVAQFAEHAVFEDPVGPSFFDPEGIGHHGREAIGSFWDQAIAPVAEFRVTITDSFANGAHCANVGTIRVRLEDGSRSETDLVAVYRVDEAGLLVSVRAYWEVERMLATLRTD